MALSVLEFSTGACVLPDIGVLQYNGIDFSSLYTSTLSGRAMEDEAKRTVKAMEYTLRVEGTVTLNTGEETTDNAWVALRRKLSQQGGILYYERKGFGPVLVNARGGTKDVAWGPVPKVLEFQPLGGSRAATIRWEVTYTVPELENIPNPLPVLQFNNEISISYDDECFTKLSIKGTLEIPMTRTSVDSRVVPATVDAYRQKYLQAVADSFDLTRFHVTARHFNISRDRRTMEWEFTAEELPYMGLPAGATSARGTFSVRTQKNSYALMPYVCSLRCTYTIANAVPRRIAWMHFISLARYRMQRSALGVWPKTDSPASDPHEAKPSTAGAIGALAGAIAKYVPLPAASAATDIWEGGKKIYGAVAGALASEERLFTSKKDERRAFPMAFEVDEGLYLDSRKITFGITWMLTVTFSTVLAASGVWTYPGGPTDGAMSRELWAATMAQIQGWRGVLANRTIAGADVIVDMGSK